MATTKKTNATKKTNGSKTTKTSNSKAKKTNDTKKPKEESGVVDEFLDTVVGETMTQEDADNNENRKQELKERWEKLGMNEGMQEEVKESVADMYAKQAAELIKEAEENEPDEEQIACHLLGSEEDLIEISSEQIENELNREPNHEPDDEPNEGEQQFDELFKEKPEAEEPIKQTQNIVYVNSAMGASWD